VIREFSTSILLALALLIILSPLAGAQWGGSSGISVRIAGEDEGGGGGGSNYTILTVEGYAYPDALVTILRNKSVLGTTRAKDDGSFKATIWTQNGSVTIGVWARDNYGLISQTSEVPAYIPAVYSFTISDIFLSPTLGTDSLVVVPSGTKVNIFGSAFPDSGIKLFSDMPDLNGADITTAGTDGKWEYVIDTEGLVQGLYAIRVNGQVVPLGLISDLSREIRLGIGFPIEPYEGAACSGVDLNFDGRVNVIDFSIMLYYWELNPFEVKPPNYCVDQDENKLVDIYDFSRLMYGWKE